jgi:hypothetical protein
MQLQEVSGIIRRLTIQSMSFQDVLDHHFDGGCLEFTTFLERFVKLEKLNETVRIDDVSMLYPSEFLRAFSDRCFCHTNIFLL